MKLRITLVVAAVVLGFGCSRTSTAPAPQPATIAPQLSREQTKDVISFVRDRFVPEGDGFVGRAERLTARAQSDGTISLTAFDPRRPGAGHVATLQLNTVNVTGAQEHAGHPQLRDAVLELPRGTVTERWKNVGEGFEQSWQFDRANPDGAIEVNVAVKGFEYGGQTSGELTFVEPSSHLMVRYSDATFIDASGTRTTVPARYERGEIHLRVPVDVVARSTFPAVLDPFISANPIPLDAPVQGDADANQRTPSVAFNGSGFLVAWDDSRNPDTGSDIWAVRLDSTGNPIEQYGFVVSNATGNQTVPEVATDGTDYAVVWNDNRNSGGTGVDIYGTRVLSDATVVTPNGGPLVASGGDQLNPAITWESTSSRYLVAWNALSAGTQDIFAQAFSQSLQAVGGQLTVNSVAGDQKNPRVARIAANTVLVVWTDGRNSLNTDIYGARVNVAGPSMIDAATTGLGLATSAASASTQPNLGANPAGGALLAWTDKSPVTGSTTVSLMAERLSSTATILDAAPVFVEPAQPFTGGFFPNGYFRPAVQADATHYEVLYAFGSFLGGPLYRARIPFGGGAATARETLVSAGGVSSIAATAAPNQKVFTAFGAINLGTGGLDVRGALLDTTIPSSGAQVVQVARTANSESNVAVGGGPNMAFVAWVDSRNIATNADIYGVRVSWDGGVLDSAAIPISNSLLADSDPSVAGSPSGFLVGWTEGSTFTVNGADAGIRSVDFSGTLGAPYYFPNGTDVLATHWDGRQYLVLFNDNTGTHLARVSPQGSVVEVGGSFPNSVSGYVRMASTPDETLVAWNDNGGPSTTDVAAALLRTDGGIAVSAPIVISNDVSFTEAYPSVASNGSEFLVTWCDARMNTTGSINGRLDVFGAKVDTAGTVGTPFPIALDGGDKSNTAAVWDGQHYAVFWEQKDAGSLPTELRLRYLNADGGALTDQLIIQQAGGEYRYPAVAARGDGRTILGFQQFSAPDQSRRAFIKVVRLTLNNGESCSSAADCESGFCTEGVCCNSACGNGDANDCQACSTAQGAAVDGQCTMLPTTHQCRAGGTDPSCEAAEFCDGVTPFCPPDIAKPLGAECRPAAGPCDVAETCDGTSRECPADVLLGTDVVCRQAAKACDAPEKCDGLSAGCPADVLAPASSVCRPAANGCDTPELCTGTTDECPADAFERDGLVCSDVTNGVCQAGQCITKTQDTHYGLVKCGCGSADGAPLIIGVALLGFLFRRRRGAAALVALIAVGLGSTAHAADAEKMKLSYLGLKAGAGISVADADTLSNYVQSQLTALEVYDVIGSNEIAAIVGQERQKMLLGCSDEASSCLAEIAGALNAQRVVNGDVAVVGETTILNLSLIDMNDQKLIKRVAVKADGTTPEVLIDKVPDAVVQLASADPKLAGQEIHLERGFGGVMAGLRGDGDVVGRGFSPGVMAELSGKHFGGALTVLLGATAASNGTRQIFPGLRAEARFFPIELGLVRPYIAAGASVFAPDVAARGAVGLAVRFGSLQLFADAAYERFFNPRANDGNFHQDAVLIGAGAGWQF